MKQTDFEHLASITVEGLIEHQQELLSTCVSHYGRNGSVRIGVNGYGKFCVKTAKELFVCESPKEAIQKYTIIYTKLNS